MTQLRFHGLLAKVKEQGKQKPNMWLLTRRAGDFLNGRKRVPAYVYTQNNKVIDRAMKKVTRKDFKILSDFNLTYEIIENKVVSLFPIQEKLI